MFNRQIFSFILVTITAVFLIACTATPQSTLIPPTPIVTTDTAPTALMVTATSEVIEPLATHTPIAEIEAIQPTNTLVPTAVPDPTRVLFAPGNTSAVLAGEVLNGEMDQYVLGAQQGQELTAVFANPDRNTITLSIAINGQTLIHHKSNAALTLPLDGDYVVSVHGLDDMAHTYQLTVAISALASTPPLNDLDYSARVEWISFLDVPTECGTSAPIDAPLQAQNLSGITIHQVEANKYLIQLDCDAFAYSTHARLYLYDANNDSGTAVFIPEFDPTANNVINRDILWGSDFNYDPNTQQFTNFQKGRGVGDCGALNTYQYAQEQLTLIESRQRSCHTDQDPLPPQEWPIVYPTG